MKYRIKEHMDSFTIEGKFENQAEGLEWLGLTFDGHQPIPKVGFLNKPEEYPETFRTLKGAELHLILIKKGIVYHYPE